MNPPYTDDVWQKIRACGDSVEASLAKSGVLLTMGGEPTFVPLMPEGSEWQTSALGPTKLGYARKLAREMVQRAFPGASLLEIAGKQYPGEALPRWAVLLHRRMDGKKLWRDITRLRADIERGTHTAHDAERLLFALAGKLGVSPRGILAAHEATAPDATVGYVLPLDHDGEKWVSDDWRVALKADSAKLLFGDSLIGLRLPLAALTEENLRRALTIEIRDGTVTIFIPPLSVEAYLEIVPLIEDSLEAEKLKDIVLGGYAPPVDPRVTTVGLASDPGVIEINLAVCATWADYDKHLGELYAAAEHTGLTARKLHFNGRETGTGGGAHLVFGGPIGLTSPFFAFPALLPSTIRYFQHHPALSYGFTGAYMGPSSQAPRIDESTFEALYELEIACEGAERLGSPWNLPLFDLMFRDLLMDRTGNTHRAEISVDKLWNAFAGNGRLGLVEFRAFESHPQVAAQSVTALFVRAILARLAADPFKSPFVRWAGELHDRFFLPAFVWEDLTAICADLKAHDIPFEVEWLRPLWEWRFPKIGEFALAKPEREEKKTKIPAEPFSLIFRQALEAWPLLGEQPNGSGSTSRSVDASMDRIEASIADAKFLESGVLLVNGLPCEFRATENGGAACGVRFRAFYLTPALHPHIPVHSPLLIEWVEKETLTVVAAARWHVWNPTSSPYLNRPANEAEARERHAERWQVWTATIGEPRFIPKVDFPPEGKHTLDLRRYQAQSR